MAARTLRVEFVPEDVLDERPPAPQVHDVSVDSGVPGTPEVLENPHVDFPGTWTLIGEGPDGTLRYRRAARVADTSDTAAL
ncbi:hypothetical protein [uncultured Amnibacterium sp.]|uniref:hypothetical protein n=1 Tax=uncultured Amnibacterium sp. TaxID=1631851 RepID=UPI0035CB90FA